MIDYFHFSHIVKPQEVFRFVKELETFDVGLKKILIAELTIGNLITGVTTDWPERGAISVILQNPFSCDADVPEVVHKYVSDAHYGREQYASSKSNDSIFC